MIATLLRIGFLNVRRDRVVLALTFLLPIIFFSIFASVFGQQRDTTAKVHVAVADLDRSDYSMKLVSALAAEGGLLVRLHEKDEETGPLLDRASAEALVRAGTVPVAIVLPRGFAEGGTFFSTSENARQSPGIGRHVRPHRVAGRTGPSAEGGIHRRAGVAGHRRHGDAGAVRRPVDAGPAPVDGRLDDGAGSR